MTNLSLKYKDRLPEDTIKIIQDFFLSYNYKIIQSTCCLTEANTYYCSYDLYDSLGNICCSSNGKGTSLIYCQASGMAELYENFCSKIYQLNNSIILNKWLNYKENHSEINYTIFPKDKPIAYEENLSIPFIKRALINLFQTEKNAKKFIQLNYPEGSYAVPCANINDDNDIQDIDIRLAFRINGSCGLATGNTIDEATVQAISELLERMAIGKVFADTTSTFYTIDKNILSPELINIVDSIEEKGNKIYIYDLSYTYNIPVCLVIKINKQTGCMNYNFGSSPIFCIAVERCLTELYQGDFSLIGNPPVPQIFEGEEKYKFLSQAFSAAHLCNMNLDYLILHTEHKTQYNTNCYYSFGEECSNILLFEFYNKLNTKNNIKIYRTNLSLMDEMSVVYCYIDNYIFDYSRFNDNLKVNLKDIDYFLGFLQYYNDCVELLINNQFTKDNLLTLLKLYNQGYNKLFGLFIYQIFEPYGYNCHSDNILSIFTNICLDKFNYFNYSNNLLVGSIYKKQFEDFSSLIKYCQSNCYTKEQLKQIFSFFNNSYINTIDKTDIDILTCLYNIIILSFNNIYQNSQYDNYIISLFLYKGDNI